MLTAAQAYPTNPVGHDLAQPHPTRHPQGPVLDPQKPNSGVTAKWLPGCSPLSSALTIVISRPQLSQAQRPPEWPFPGSGLPPPARALPLDKAKWLQRAPPHTLAPTLPSLPPLLQDPPGPASLPPSLGLLSPSFVVCPLWVPVSPGSPAIQAMFCIS